MSVAIGCLLLASAVAEPFTGVPADTTLLAVVPNPRALVEGVRDWPGGVRASRLPAAREAFESPGLKRLGGLIDYYEHDLGDDWPEILDRVAGRGVTFAAIAGEVNGPVVGTLRGTDPETSRRFVELAIGAVLAEAERQAVPGEKLPKVERESIGGFDIIRVENVAYFAIRGATVRVSNRAETLTKSLAALAGRVKALDPARPLAGRGLLMGDPKAWAWLDLKSLKTTPQSRDFFANALKNAFATIVLGSTIDAVRRADDLAIGLGVSDAEFFLQVRLSAGRGGMPAELRVHAPGAGEPGTPPLLMPPGAIYSQGLYLDLATLWADRTRVFNPQSLKDVEKFDADVSKVLPGAGFGEMLRMTGPRHRIVLFPPPDKPLYQSTPLPDQPGGVLVIPMRDRELGKSLAKSLRAGAAIAGLTAGVKLADETHGGVAMAVIRFPEGRTLEGDPDGLRFHTMPAFTAHGNHFLIASRPDLIPRVTRELDRKHDEGSRAVWRGVILPAGLAAWARAHPEPLVADAIQRRGRTLEAARREVDQLAELLAITGPLSLTADNGPDSFAWTLRWVADAEKGESK